MATNKVLKEDHIVQEMRLQGQLLQRFATIRAFVVARKITQYVPVFTAVDPSLQSDADRMRKLFTNDVRMQPEDESMISKMERVIEHLAAA